MSDDEMIAVLRGVVVLAKAHNHDLVTCVLLALIGALTGDRQGQLDLAKRVAAFAVAELARTDPRRN